MAFALFEAPIAEQHRHIDIGAQHVEAAFAGDQADVDLRIGRVKSMQTRHQPISGEGEIRSDLQHLVLMLRADRAQSCVDILQTEPEPARKRIVPASVNSIPR